MAAQSAQDALRAELDRPVIKFAPQGSIAGGWMGNDGAVRDSLDISRGNNDTSVVEDQELSFAVAACEPELAQLMEDLEVRILPKSHISINMWLFKCKILLNNLAYNNLFR